MATLTPWIVTTASVAIVAAWTRTYLLTISAVVFTRNAVSAGPMHRWLLFVFVLNAVLNALLNVVFFTVKRPDWALVEIVFLLLCTVSMILVSIYYPTTAALLLPVYLSWVSFATLSNSAVVWLNRPFRSQLTS